MKHPPPARDRRLPAAPPTIFCHTTRFAMRCSRTTFPPPPRLAVLPVLLLLLLLSASVSHAEVIMVQIVHRHGARAHLKKHPYDPDRDSPRVPLLPEGVRQLVNLGKFVRSTYVESGVKQITGISTDDRPGHGDVLAYSSNTRRTLMSSRAFLNGLYEGALTPTMVFARDENDWILRGYSNCPQLAVKFKKFLDSPEFKSKKSEDDNEAFIARLARNLEDEDTKFENVVNVYDRYQIIKHNGYGRPNSDSGVSPLGDADFNRLKGLADWYESSKFNFGAHGIRVASGLLRKILERMRTKISKGQKREPRRIYEYSAHYPTLLTLWATLRAGNPDEGPKDPADKIPGFGAALIFELHKEGTEYIVRMLWRDGESEAKAVAVGRVPCNDGVAGCKFDQMDQMLSTNDLGAAQFCQDCQAEGERDVDVCHARSGVDFRSGRVTAGAVGGVVGLTFGLVLALVCMRCVGKRKRRGFGLNDSSFTGEDEAFEGPVRA